MANKVNPTPNLGRPVNLLSFQAIGSFISAFVNALFLELGQHAVRLNQAYINDGLEVSAQLPSYTVATLPSAASAGQTIYVSNETGGATLAFADGTNWRRVQDRNIVS